MPFLNAASVPTGPKHTPVFEAFSYTIDPHERRDEVRKARLAADHEKMRAGAFKAGGRAFRGDKRAMQSRQGELLKGVQRCFRTDWNAYLGTTVDARGYLVAEFAAESLSELRRGDLHAYMNRFIGHNGLATEFGLTRDPARWGAPGVGTRQGAVHAESEAALLYALRPPWVANDPLAAERQRAAAARANRDRPRSATEVDAPPEEHAFVLGTAGFK